MQAKELKGGDIVQIDGTSGQVQSVIDVKYNAVPALLVDIHFRPGHRIDPKRAQFYIRPEEEVTRG